MRKYTVVDIVCRYSRRLWPQLCTHTRYKNVHKVDWRTRRLGYDPKWARSHEPRCKGTGSGEENAGNAGVQNYHVNFCIYDRTSWLVPTLVNVCFGRFSGHAYRVYKLSQRSLIRPNKEQEPSGSSTSQTDGVYRLLLTGDNNSNNLTRPIHRTLAKQIQINSRWASQQSRPAGHSVAQMVRLELCIRLHQLISSNRHVRRSGGVICISDL